ncbi:MAG: TetR/AcrR family transcriptional regulator [Chthoniobacteraceae bacterium]|nr:TetR/AcrR family transcriptional regulator [Chthoniobacteraceae bacterium]
MKPPCETKGKLLQVALRLIWENSYGAVGVEEICREAGVKKGSFYYFFPSKSDLTVAAMEAHWEDQRAALDRIFSPQTPPLARIAAYCQSVCERQEAKKKEYGKVCGCPMVTLGAELSTQDEAIRRKTAEIMGRYTAYFEAALRDAMAQGLSHCGDPGATARRLFAFSQGLLLQAKVHNDLSPLADLRPGMAQMLGLQARSVAA